MNAIISSIIYLLHCLIICSLCYAVAYRVYNYSIFAANSVGEGLSADGVFLTREDSELCSALVVTYVHYNNR